MTTPLLHQAVAAVVIGAVVLATAAPTAAQAASEPAFVVEVHADGSADVSVRSTFDLTTGAEREAFQSLADDEAARDAAVTRFADRLQSVAREASNATGREMAVRGASIDLQQPDDATGIVTLSATWEGLAAVEDETLVITEPFGSGYAPDRPLVLHVPDGYEIARASPEPDATGEGSATWDAGTDLEGFSIELTRTPTGADSGGQSGGQPGFGALVSVIAILVAVGSAARYRTRR